MQRHLGGRASLSGLARHDASAQETGVASTVDRAAHSRLVVFVTIATLTRVAGQAPFPPPPPASGGNVTD